MAWFVMLIERTDEAYGARENPINVIGEAVTAAGGRVIRKQNAGREADGIIVFEGPSDQAAVRLTSRLREEGPPRPHLFRVPDAEELVGLTREHR